MHRILLVSVLLLLLAACASQPTPAPTPDVVATEVAVARAVAATLTAEAPEAMADYVATQVAAARFAVATLTAEALAVPSSAPPTPAETPATPPGNQPTIPPPPPPVPQGGQELAGGLSLRMREVVDDGQAEYGYHVWAPHLAGSDQPSVEAFNRAVDGFVAFAIDDFQAGVNQVAMGPGSSLWITHTVTAATDDLVSVLFYVDGYVMGAAHPFHYAHTLNYHLEQARILGLSDLFRPGVQYLEALSEYSLDDLSRQGVLEWEDGALPATENYQRWNITPDGLLISFDEYSIAPYAAGPQAVLVPYPVLGELIDPEGPLAPFVQ
jgi:hypothetical protein